MIVLRKRRLQGLVKKVRPLRYGSFTILNDFENNTFRLDLPPYMKMHSMVSCEYLHLYELFMLGEEDEEQLLLSLEISVLMNKPYFQKIQCCKRRPKRPEEVARILDRYDSKDKCQSRKNGTQRRKWENLSTRGVSLRFCGTKTVSCKKCIIHKDSGKDNTLAQL